MTRIETVLHELMSSEQSKRFPLVVELVALNHVRGIGVTWS